MERIWGYCTIKSRDHSGVCGCGDADPWRGRDAAPGSSSRGHIRALLVPQGEAAEEVEGNLKRLSLYFRCSHSAMKSFDSGEA